MSTSKQGKVVVLPSGTICRLDEILQNGFWKTTTPTDHRLVFPKFRRATRPERRKFLRQITL